MCILFLLEQEDTMAGTMETVRKAWTTALVPGASC